MIDRRDRIRLAAAALVAVGAPAGAALYVHARSDALAQHLANASGMVAQLGSVDADLTGTVRISDVELGELFAAESIEASVALDSLLAGELGADEIRVASPRVALAIDRDGDSDLARVVRRMAKRGGGSSGAGAGAGAASGARKVRRIRVTQGALAAKIAGVAELTADGVELVPDDDGVRILTGRVHVAGASGRVAGELELERAAAELGLPRARFGRVLAVAGTGSVAIDGARVATLRDVAIGRLAAGGSLELRATVDDDGAHRPLALALAPADLALRASGDRVPLAAFAALAPHGVDLSDARATGELVVRRDGDRLELRGDGHVDELRLDHRALGPQPIAISARIAGALTVAPDSIALADGALELGAAKLAASGWVRRGAPASGQLELRLQAAPCADLLAALPVELRGPLDGMALTGTFGGRARVAIDLAAPPGDGVTLDTALGNGCEVAIEPPAADVTTLAAPPKDRADWAKLRDLPAHVPAAWLAAEDARFYDHHGFDPREIARSLEIDLRDHRLARGGSTISQQLVKNAFLTQRRSLDRKIQEAALTWRLEARLDKKTILERYLNVIELGPKLAGITAAARYWFDEKPRELTVRQAAFLAALTSEPSTMSRRVRHAGGLDADSAAHVDIVLRGMRAAGAIDAAELADAHEAAMHFAASALKAQ